MSRDSWHAINSFQLTIPDFQGHASSNKQSSNRLYYLFCYVNTPSSDLLKFCYIAMSLSAIICVVKFSFYLLGGRGIIVINSNSIYFWQKMAQACRWLWGHTYLHTFIEGLKASSPVPGGLQLASCCKCKGIWIFTVNSAYIYDKVSTTDSRAIISNFLTSRSWITIALCTSLCKS